MPRYNDYREYKNTMFLLNCYFKLVVKLMNILITCLYWVKLMNRASNATPNGKQITESNQPSFVYHYIRITLSLWFWEAIKLVGMRYRLKASLLLLLRIAVAKVIRYAECYFVHCISLIRLIALVQIVIFNYPLQPSST